MGTQTQGEVVVRAQRRDGKSKVDLAEPRVKRGDRFVVKIDDGRDAVVWVPNGNMFGRTFFELNRGNNWTQGATVLPQADLGEQTYAIYFYDKRDMAEGTSPPKMIVEPGP